MRIEIRDRNEGFIAAVREIAPDLEASCGDILDCICDAVVSPANSFGFMDGGVDYAYSMRFGWHVMDRLRAELASRPFGELLVGDALVIPTDYEPIPLLISAPTMRVPRVIGADSVFLATRAAVHAARQEGLEHIVFPGMGTGCGQVPYAAAAKAMASGISAVLSPPPAPSSWREAQARHFALEP